VFLKACRKEACQTEGGIEITILSERTHNATNNMFYELNIMLVSKNKQKNPEYHDFWQKAYTNCTQGNIYEKEIEMQNLPVTLSEIVSKSKQGFPLLISPFNHLHYHVMIVVNTVITNNLQI
jgi:hypothetical protein